MDEFNTLAKLMYNTCRAYDDAFSYKIKRTPDTSEHIYKKHLNINLKGYTVQVWIKHLEPYEIYIYIPKGKNWDRESYIFQFPFNSPCLDSIAELCKKMCHDVFTIDLFTKIFAELKYNAVIFGEVKTSYQVIIHYEYI